MNTPASPTSRTEPTLTWTGGESGWTAADTVAPAPAGALVAPGAAGAPVGLGALGLLAAGALGGAVAGPLQASAATAARSARHATGQAPRSVLGIGCSPSPGESALKRSRGRHNCASTRRPVAARA